MAILVRRRNFKSNLELGFDGIVKYNNGSHAKSVQGSLWNTARVDAKFVSGFCGFYGAPNGLTENVVKYAKYIKLSKCIMLEANICYLFIGIYRIHNHKLNCIVKIKIKIHFQGSKLKLIWL